MALAHPVRSASQKIPSHCAGAAAPWRIAGPEERLGAHGDGVLEHGIEVERSDLRGARHRRVRRPPQDRRPARARARAFQAIDCGTDDEFSRITACRNARRLLQSRSAGSAAQARTRASTVHRLTPAPSGAGRLRDALVRWARQRPSAPPRFLRVEEKHHRWWLCVGCIRRLRLSARAMGGVGARALFSGISRYRSVRA